MRTKFVTDKRPILDCMVNGIHAYFLFDTGASISLIDDNNIKRYGLKKGRRYNGAIVGANGSIEDTYVCNDTVYVQGKPISQFIFSDLTDIRDSIKRETGYDILGIVSYPQMKLLGISIDPVNDTMDQNNY